MYKLKVTLKTYNTSNFQIFDKFIGKYTNLLKPQKIQKIGLKTQPKSFTLLKSPHVHKKSREQFQYKTYKQVYIVYNVRLLPLLYLNYLIITMNHIPLYSQSKIISL